MATTSNSRRQGIFWLGTLSYLEAPNFDFTALSGVCSWIKGQREVGAGGYEHWQFIVAFRRKQSLVGAKRILGMATAHLELSRSSAASDYVWKEDTRVEGTQFEIGGKPIERNRSQDWEEIWEKAKVGDYLSIPAQIRVSNYRTLRLIASDCASPVPMVRFCNVFWGATGTGKSRRAWEESGMDAYSKDPRTKFWDGYEDQDHVVIDEFRGGIDIAHLLRWLDRYPVRVEIKGASKPLKATTFWITSNVDPLDWYPEADLETKSALMRRLEVSHFA